MSIQSRNSVLALMAEVTEGTPVIPAGATDFIALQDDFTMEPAFENLENAELKSSLGQAKSIVGLESPTASLSHYLRASGDQTAAPNYNELLKAAFGTESVSAAEYNTVAASTTSVIKVDAAEGASFERGEALRIQDSTNGFNIRPIHSISSDDLTLGFGVAVAPGVGVELGRAVTYSPANSGHQTLSVWNYVGNEGCIQLMAGARVTEFSMSVAAGELINSNYSLEGVEYFFNPMQTTASNYNLDFTDDNGTFATAVAADFWKDPHELAAAIASAMNTIQTAETHDCSYSDSAGKFTISTSTSAVLTLLWKTGASGADGTDLHIGTLLGFDDAADDSAATSYSSDTAQDWSASYTPTFDSSDPLVAKDNECLIGEVDDLTCFEAASVDFTLSDTKRDILSICAASGKSGSIINAREVTVSVSALLNQHDADAFRRMRENSETRFCYIGGTKSGGSWQAGKCFCLYLPTAVVSSFSVTDDDGLASLEMELTAYVDDSGNGEVYLSFV
ncbi:hypothetical protein DRH27_01585 [Candidatus Falkowbacteria bacterium]|nr:MAG: hypothetical protein DRH27_01585 [Candidatus Falkowbacteria bacterium]